MQMFLDSEQPFRYKDIERSKVYEQYRTFCREQEIAPLSRYQFIEALRNKGYNAVKIHGIMVYKGNNEPLPDNFQPVPSEGE